MSNISELLDTLLEIREGEYVHLPDVLIEKILNIEAYYADNRSEAIKRIEDEVLRLIK